jgi:hypothetical protein
VPAGRYSVWLEASVGRAATVYVDNRRVGSLADALNPRLSVSPVGAVRLGAGRHPVRLDVGGGMLDPRNGGFNRLIGPVYLSPLADPAGAPVRTVDSSRWRSLCGAHADWVEAVA